MLRAFRDALLIPELRSRVIFTLIVLALYRLGTFIPTPGVDYDKIISFLNTNPAGSALGIINLFSGGNFERFSIFALGIMPYITAAIIMQLLVTIVPSLEKLQKEGEEGRRIINQYTRIAGVALGAVQGFFLATTFLGSQSGAFLLPGWSPGPFLWLVVVVTQVAGIAILLWLAERITEYGVGNGTSMIIMGGIVASWLPQIIQTFGLVRTGEINLIALILFFAFVVAAFAGMAAVQQSERRIPVQYARKVVGRRVFGGQATYIPIKLNAAGVVPIVFAAALLQIPIFFTGTVDNPTLQTIANFFNPRHLSGLIIEVVLIVAFTYVYTAVQFDPRRIAENLREYGGFIPGIRPGEPTVKFLEHIVSRLTLWGALFLGLVAALPTLMQNLTGVTTLIYHFSGISLLIVVGVALDTLRQIESQLMLRNYEGFMTKGRIRGRGRF
ncbi:MULTISPECIES: preprotein translocase subunit SecY [unclassified Meiothermus]|uniref:preprotein translocase subunit SecY n=1 Tax=unclassified Meiothermus TaxID=370471 RepID=UPI000D7BBA8D|nr:MULTISPECIES: preprotein translocase subunit SecY [unclassified Meiothermus]PZA05710.1 preprotein translocase subunit SecY [Meiothermus sp. Pnk-1]RYM30285.1 preprotein translocase subunit SecY [Meiothermus sp. PNK-Is4]